MEKLDDKRGFFSDRPVFETLIKEVRPKTIVEVGSWKGHSAVAIARICQSLGIFCDILCVDTFLGSQEHWLNEKYRDLLKIENGCPQYYYDFLSNIVHSGVQSFVTPVCLPAATASVVLSKFKIRADLIYIDAGHEYDDVTNDITNFLPLLSKKGVMFGDDYPHPPLREAVDDFANSSSLKVAEIGRKWVFRSQES
ncbi:MAG: class I SAM-dependent methyltransferase [Pseudomonadota bacterium]